MNTKYRSALEFYDLLISLKIKGELCFFLKKERSNHGRQTPLKLKLTFHKLKIRDF